MNIQKSCASSAGRSPGSAPIDTELSSKEKSRVNYAKEAMTQYQDYVNEVNWRFEGTYKHLKDFLDRGSCRCHEKSRCTCKGSETICTCAGQCSSCVCNELGMLCLCSNTNDCKCSEDPQLAGRVRCGKKRIEHIVRIYDISQGKETWGGYLNVRKFDAGARRKDECGSDIPDGGFEELQLALFEEGYRAPIFGEDNLTDQSGTTKPKVSRLITVSHLSANVAKLLGGKFNIPADFFNRHLPGTEPISGRLISRLPSSVQIDFDELYESDKTFQELFPGLVIEDGHHIIRSMMEQNFLFGDIGWNYFPVPQKDFEKCMKHSRLSSGFEILNHEKRKNVFQFTLTHRISVFSNPPGHPSTGMSKLCTYSHGNAILTLTSNHPILPEVTNLQQYETLLPQKWPPNPHRGQQGLSLHLSPISSNPRHCARHAGNDLPRTWQTK
jgi:hypothetical protein